MTYWYISFATDDLFLGATVVEAADGDSALEVATSRGLNPGGQAAIVEVPEEAESHADMKMLLNRLVKRQEMLASGAVRHGDADHELQGGFEAAADFIEPESNPVNRTR